MTDTTKETTYEEKGHRVPENPKARKKSVNYTLAKIQKLVTEFETIKLDYANQKKTIKIANAKIKELEDTITVQRTTNDAYCQHLFCMRRLYTYT